MDLRLSDEQSQLVETFASLYARESSPERVRTAEKDGFDRDLWRRLSEMGAVTMARPEAAGGWGASLLDLALVAEQSGRALASAPLVEAQVAARCLDRLHATQPDNRLTTLAVRPTAGSTATLVAAGAVADDAIVLCGDRLIVVSLDGRRTPVDNLANLPLADVEVGSTNEHPVIASGGQAVSAYRTAVDEWLVLTAAALVGVASRALEIAVDYAKNRRASGQPIGCFQAISHPLADAATAIDGARLLAQEAAWAAGEEPARASELAAMAFAFAYQTARDTTYDALHTHGGYGFTMEYDIQLFYRRCRGWGLVWGDPADAFCRVADARYGREG